jgi:hypothetical protein
MFFRLSYTSLLFILMLTPTIFGQQSTQLYEPADNVFKMIKENNAEKAILAMFPDDEVRAKIIDQITDIKIKVKGLMESAGPLISYERLEEKK